MMAQSNLIKIIRKYPYTITERAIRVKRWGAVGLRMC
jgi:hypothetical protein